MSELRNNDTLTTADLANPERTRRGGEGSASANDGTASGAMPDVPERRVIVNERQQPLEALADPTGRATNRRVEDSQVLYQGPASDAEVDDVGLDDDRIRGSDAVPPPRSAVKAASESRSTGNPRTTSDAAENHGPLFPADELQQFRSRWDQVQASFVDEPRRAVEDADNLVANVVKRIAEQFAEQRSGLESQWDHGEDATTEDLRQGLRRYRAFFDRLLSM